ncbi:MAG: methyltransferase domain-containing protein, partial [Candidatus Woesearchaeota archaeon]|nr:methyltransferase domain-containing protein [Candidatus Woesearchaeota archaeon]
AIMIMLQALEPKESDKVLEIGTGSGYNAALLSKLVKKVVTTEIIPELVEYAKKNLKKAGIKNVEVFHSDGSRGHKKEAPYDKIIVTAACPEIPLPLIEQLKENGIIVAPVGPLYSQKMIKGTKKKGKLVLEELGDFVFVPLKGKHGY